MTLSSDSWSRLPAGSDRRPRTIPSGARGSLPRPVQGVRRRSAHGAGRADEDLPRRRPTVIHTLEDFAAAAHRMLAAEPNPNGREKVCALLREVLTDEAFIAKHLGDDVPERKILYEDPDLGFCILATSTTAPRRASR